MNKLGKEKRNQLILIGMGTAGAVAAIWLLLISAQLAKINVIRGKITGAERDIAQRKQVLKEADEVKDKLQECHAHLCEIESTMPSGPPFTWVNSMLRRFNDSSYRIDMPAPGLPQLGDMTMIPDFPYRQYDVGVTGTGYYYDIGRFISDFENRFPAMRVQNLDLAPATTDDREKLTFRMDVVILTKNDGA